MSSYTGSSCENIFKKYPEIHRRINPKDRSGYYRLDNNVWIYCDMAEIAADFITMCSVVEVGESRMKPISYQPLLPGESCESIYKENAKDHNSPGHYWLTSRVYCGMNHTAAGSSCEDIHTTFTETQ